MFEHTSELGNAYAHTLFARLSVTRGDGANAVASDFGAYSIAFDGRSLAVDESLDAAPGATLTRRA